MIFFKKLITLHLIAILFIGFSNNISAEKFQISIYDPGIPPELAFKYRPLVDLVRKLYSKRVTDKSYFSLFSPREFRKNQDLIISGRVDISRLTPFEFLLASKESELQPFSIELKREKPTTTFAFIARADDPRERLSDFKSFELALLSRKDIAGRYLPLFYLSQAGVDLNEVIEVSVNVTTPNAIHEVMRKRAALGVVDLSTFHFYDFPLVKPIFTYEVPNPVWVAKAEMSQEKIIHLKETFFTINAPETFELIGISGLKVFEEDDMELFSDALAAWEKRSELQVRR